ncbi:hypothetical protein AVEN_232430-1 [Araneus ventricosus]|uniref:Uncharacterized protein n=1 Tax=Araneus ventricosus TaxID=182803 RepID=A0A4Y2VT31_ARAVE|nr:hypothetical protein AVEN_232430-1 [Araneus ventricosus]
MKSHFCLFFPSIATSSSLSTEVLYGPLKKFINTACDSWISNNKRSLTGNDIPSIFATAQTLATTTLNIKSGFRVTGIYSLNIEMFQDADFMPSFVTNRP